ASWTYGLLGRSPDHVASFLTGLAMCPELFESNRDGFGKNLTDYYDRMRRQDLFACYVVVAPQGARNPEMYARKTSIAHGLQVTAEKDDGIILNGMKLQPLPLRQSTPALCRAELVHEQLLPDHGKRSRDAGCRTFSHAGGRQRID